MDYLEYPTADSWEERRAWFERTNEKYAGQGSYLVSEQACALLAEVQASYCTGAWIAVVVLAFSVVDAQLRETEVLEFRGNTASLIDKAGANPQLQQLRKFRNRIVHIDLNSPAVTVDDQWFRRDELEFKAREAVELMFEAFYISPSV